MTSEGGVRVEVEEFTQCLSLRVVIFEESAGGRDNSGQDSAFQRI
jgi:hypothetical protein